MHPDAHPDADTFGAAMCDHLAAAEERNAETLDTVADRILDAVRDDRRIHVTGTGHSSALVLEAFYRAGGLACVNPITHPGLVPLNGGIASTVMERTAELADVLLAQARPEHGDVAVVFSNSGANPLPVTLARGLRDAGVWLTAVCSRPHLEAAPARADAKLDEIADAFLDTGAPVGDVAFELDGVRTAPLSSLTSIFLWNLILTRVADRARHARVDLPLWTSANVPGGDERNADLLARYRPRIPLL
jgi:uncharacterized phosphosugar-binding protein